MTFTRLDTPKSEFETRLRAALARSPFAKAVHWPTVVAVIVRDGITIMPREAAVAKIRRYDPATAWLVEREMVPAGSVLVLDKRPADGPRAVVFELGAEASS